MDDYKNWLAGIYNILLLCGFNIYLTENSNAQIITYFHGIQAASIVTGPHKKKKKQFPISSDRQ